MINSLFVPSGVTVRGTPGKTILRKSAGVESPLAEDGDYGESVLMAVHPENLRPGMGITISDDAQTLAGMSALRPSPLWKDECSASGR
jgi:hypothetical protein